MTDLRDQVADFDAAARRLLTQPPVPAAIVRGLCRQCYYTRWNTGHLPHTARKVMRHPDFVADYQLLRSEGYTRRQIAERLRMTYSAVTQAYLRAVRAGKLTPDRRPA